MVSFDKKDAKRFGLDHEFAPYSLFLEIWHRPKIAYLDELMIMLQQLIFD